MLTMKRFSWQRRKLRSSSSSSMRFCSQAFFSRETYRWALRLETRMKVLYWEWRGSCTPESAGGQKDVENQTGSRRTRKAEHRPPTHRPSSAGRGSAGRRGAAPRSPPGGKRPRRHSGTYPHLLLLLPLLLLLDLQLLRMSTTAAHNALTHLQLQGKWNLK